MPDEKASTAVEDAIRFLIKNELTEHVEKMTCSIPPIDFRSKSAVNAVVDFIMKRNRPVADFIEKTTAETARLRAIVAGQAEVIRAMGEDGLTIPAEPTRMMWAAAGNRLVTMNLNRHHDRIAEAVWQEMAAAAKPSAALIEARAALGRLLEAENSNG